MAHSDKRNNAMILAVKSAPEESILSAACRAKLEAVELYLSAELLTNVPRTAKLCRGFPLRYAVHAPNDGSAIDELVELAKEIRAEIVVFHNNYWEDEWGNIVERFKKVPVRLCIENTYSVHEPVKFMRRYGMGRCLDLEHLQMEAAGVYGDVFIEVIREAAHIHLSGYRYGFPLWHTHIHHSAEHGRYMLGLLKKADYSGFVVSEAKVSLQTYAEFKKLREFYNTWKKASAQRRC